MFIKVLFIIVFIVVFIFRESETQISPIPSHLIECYQKGVILLPMTMTTLIDIIRKVELNQDYVMDMRMIANSIMKRFWRDGIERDPNILPGPGVIPYTTAAFQSYKYSILYSGLLPGTGKTFPNETLTLSERCTLHFMISGAVDPWERGDETLVCREASLAQRAQISYIPSGTQKSSCPIEKGVVLTNGYGTVNAGHIILAIAMALQPMEIIQSSLIGKNINIPAKEKYTKVVDNLWAATLCGDLAEIIIFQTPSTNNVSIGPSGNWNSSYLPTDYYMEADQNFINCGCWQNTDSEIIGSIDGLILANEAVKWSSLLNTLQLSQMLEMYYTNIGGNIAGQSHACKRSNYFFNDLDSQSEMIKQQTISFAEILAITAPHLFVHEEEYIQNNIDRVYNTFVDQTRRLLWNQMVCPENKKLALPKLQMNVIYDSTWSSYYMLQFLMRLSLLVDVSQYGSNVTVINGANGITVVDSANTEGDLYRQWRNFTENKDVKSTGLLKGFLQLKHIIEKNNTQESLLNIATGRVTVVIGLSASISDKDFSDILNVLKTIKTEAPDMTFFYLTTQANTRTFVKFTSIQRAEDDYIIASDRRDQNILLKDLNNILKLTRNLIPPPCFDIKKFTELTYEEYITPEQPYIYKIHPSYLCSSNRTITIKIKNNNYGNLDICLSRTSFTKDLKNTTCKSATLFDEIEFTVDNECILNNFEFNNNCQPIFIQAIGRSSLRKCTEKDCRFPNQLRYSIIVKGLTCVKDMQVTCASSLVKNNLLILFIIICIYLFVNSCK